MEKPWMIQTRARGFQTLVKRISTDLYQEISYISMEEEIDKKKNDKELKLKGISEVE